VDEVLKMTPQQTRGRRPDHGPRDTAFSRALNAEKQRLGRPLTGAEVNEIRCRVVEKLAFKGVNADTKHQ
jgi:hypothetical protein